MNDYILFMHADAPRAPDAASWSPYFEGLRASGRFDGGSSIGGGTCVSKTGTPPPISAQLGGYIRVRAESLEDARRFLAGNPVYEAGGTIEIRELPRD